MRLNVEVVHCGEDLNMMRPAIPWAGDFLGCLAVGKKEEAPQKCFFFVLVQGEKEETSKWAGARVRRRRQPRSKEVS